MKRAADRMGRLEAAWLERLDSLTDAELWALYRAQCSQGGRELAFNPEDLATMTDADLLALARRLGVTV